MTILRRPSSIFTTFLSVGLLGLVASPFLAGCSGDIACDGCNNQGTGASSSSGSSSGTASSGGTSSSSSGSVTAGWTQLITGDWTLAPGSENTSDIHSKVVDHDIFVGGIRPISPVGTHHTVVAAGGLGTGNTIYASGVGTNELVFPKGVGLKIPAGETVVLQLHVFNTSSEPLSGTSGVEILEIPAADIEQEADLFLPGPFDFSIPPNQKYTHTGTCTVKAPQSVFAVFPHMHQLGSHFKTTLTIGGAQTVIHDSDYVFEHQPFIPFEPIKLSPGDTISTECTWDNSTPMSVGWGESSTSEMCFSILYRYPPVADNGFCMN